MNSLARLNAQFSTKMTPEQKIEAQRESDMHNKKINNGKTAAGNAMGKDSFLKLLVTQLRHQDPTKPLEDKEFVSQMAQFSSLEQITNLNKEMNLLLKSTMSSEAHGLIGKSIEGISAVTKKPVSGTVTSVMHRGSDVTLKVGNEELTLENIHSVR